MIGMACPIKSYGNESYGNLQELLFDSSLEKTEELSIIIILVLQVGSLKNQQLLTQLAQKFFQELSPNEKFPTGIGQDKLVGNDPTGSIPTNQTAVQGTKNPQE